MTRHKKSIPNRSHRVADQIQRDVAELIRELKDPRVGMVTINAVEAARYGSSVWEFSTPKHTSMSEPVAW